ncbi:hypothetical protein HanXRQr2_Chr07g0281711 [Helianthus annuus]|uniref:Uncharacterized protein n=1 Tax=Helianthus annuus TaxID=4232 RepID=A0A9K3NFD5_HELAN|nr:hypothetical protein HanXRQr2_Chr07g0281711 [Helianthus annuus]KAJ0903666.1 hypothetical protein HanPSC8_Chr07g0272601 [Helianthus annuus]
MLSIEESVVVLLGAWTSMYIYQGAKLIWDSKVKRCRKELKTSWKQNKEEKRLVFVGGSVVFRAI